MALTLGEPVRLKQPRSNPDWPTTSWEPREIWMDDAQLSEIVPVLAGGGEHIRIYSHYPSQAFTWYNQHLPLRRGGPLRNVSVKGLNLDVEISLGNFFEWQVDFSDCGLNLVQSGNELPPDLDFFRFRSERSFLRALVNNGGELWLQLAHSGETASLTFLTASAFERVQALPRPWRDPI